jgi:hypothetical protein
MFGYTTTITTALIHHIARGRRFMGDLFMRDLLTIGITGLGIVRRRLDIVRMGRTSRVIDRRRTMVVGVRRTRGMVGGHLEMGTVGELVRRGMEMVDGHLGMGEGRVLRAMEGELLGMAVGLGHQGTVGELVPLRIREAAGRLLRPVPLLRLVLLRHRHRHRHRGRHQRLVLLQPQLIDQLLDLLREDLIQGIRRVVRSRRNGLSRRLVRGRVDLAGITMARRRGRRVIAAKPVLVAVGVREVNRNEAFQA